MIQQLEKDGTTWKFNPPAAAHFGGKWKAAVKSVKFRLRRTIGDILMTCKELSILLIQIEATLNSRPLSALSDDTDDLDALTPGNFLISEPLNSIPEPTLQHILASRLDCWQFLQQRLQHFWSRWSSKYLQRHLQVVSPSQRFEDWITRITHWRTLPTVKMSSRTSNGFTPWLWWINKSGHYKTSTSVLKRSITKLDILPSIEQEETPTTS